MTIEELRDKNLILLETIAGSKSFGLDTPKSDTDIKGVYYLPRDIFYGLNYIPQVSNDTNDIVYYEIGRYIKLLIKNNPNILEILSSPEDCIIYKHPLMDMLKPEYFFSRLCKDTFAGYAATQLKKARGLKKKILNPMPIDKKDLVDFCYILQGQNSIMLKQWLIENQLKQERCGLVNIPHSKGMYALYYDTDGSYNYKGIVQKETSNEVSLSSVPKAEKVIGYMHFNQDAYSSYCKEYKEYYDWIEKRNNQRYNTNKEHGKNYDSKNMMHTIRLLQSAEQIFSTGKLNVKVENREQLLEIKSGKCDYEDLLMLADELILSIEQKCEVSNLPDKPDSELIERILINMRFQLYQ